MTILWSIGDVARVLGVSTTRVRQLVAAGRLTPAARTPRGLLLCDPSVVSALAAQRAARRGR